MAQNRFYSSVAPPTQLAAPLGASGNPSVNSITGLPSSLPFTVLIDWGLATQEAISVTSAPTGTGPFTLPCTRGIDGTTAQSHSQGAIAVHGVTQEDYNEPQVHISTGVSGASYPNVIHGLVNGSAVVGTLDVQTLSNKTFGATTFTGGDVTISNSDAVGPILTVTNTHTTPTNAAFRIVAQTAADPALGIRVSGDTVNRLQSDSNGKLQWGPGASTSVDTDLYRNGVGILQTDGTFNASAVNVSESSATGNVLTVTNTHSAPSNPSTSLIAAAAADLVIGTEVTADTNFRWTVDSNGKHTWGPGNAVSDTDLYRSAAGDLATDNTLAALLGLQLGATTPAFGSGTGGILGIKNATANPSAGPASGLAMYSSSGLLNYVNTNGLNQIIVGSQLANTVTYANSVAETALATLTVPANDPINGAYYTLAGMGVVSTTGTPTLTWKVRWGGAAGTQLVTTAAITQGSGVTTLPFNFVVQVIFTSTTQAVCSLFLNYFTAAGTVPTQNYQQATAPITVTTNASEALVFTATWSAASASNTLTSWYSPERIS